MSTKIAVRVLLCAALGVGMCLNLAPALEGGENAKATRRLDEANKAPKDAAAELDRAQKDLESLPDVTPEQVADACAATFVKPAHIAACREAVMERATGKPGRALSFSEQQGRTLAFTEMVDAAPAGPAQQARQTPAQRVMWGILYEEDAQAMEKLSAHPDAPPTPRTLDLPPSATQQGTGADPQKVPSAPRNPSDWAKEEVERRAAERKEAQKKLLKP